MIHSAEKPRPDVIIKNSHIVSPTVYRYIGFMYLQMHPHFPKSSHCRNDCRRAEWIVDDSCLVIFLFSGRIGMSMTTLLTLTAMFGSVRTNVPRVSYISFLDVWMVMCIIFVFICILEFTVVTSWIRNGRKMGAERIERTCRVLIPIIFLLFNLLYWPILMSN